MILAIAIFILMFMFVTLICEGVNRWSNLPGHIDSAEEWDNKDDSKHWYTDWRRYAKSWFAYDWKKRHWFGSLRRYPVTLFAFFGGGDTRWENDFMVIRSTNNTVVWYFPPRNGFYLSRVQYWCAWHIQMTWPLGLFFHVKYGRKGIIQGYLGWKRDGDVWWFPVCFIGRGWK